MQLSPKLLQQALAFSHDAVTIFECHPGEAVPRIAYVNRAFEAMTGFEREEVLGRAPGFLQGKRTEASVLDALGSALAAGKSFTG